MAPLLSFKKKILYHLFQLNEYSARVFKITKENFCKGDICKLMQWYMPVLFRLLNKLPNCGSIYVNNIQVENKSGFFCLFVFFLFPDLEFLYI